MRVISGWTASRCATPAASTHIAELERKRWGEPNFAKNLAKFAPLFASQPSNSRKLLAGAAIVRVLPRTRKQQRDLAHILVMSPRVSGGSISCMRQTCSVLQWLLQRRRRWLIPLYTYIAKVAPRHAEALRINPVLLPFRSLAAACQ